MNAATSDCVHPKIPTLMPHAVPSAPSNHTKIPTSRLHPISKANKRKPFNYETAACSDATQPHAATRRAPSGRTGAAAPGPAARLRANMAPPAGGDRSAGGGAAAAKLITFHRLQVKRVGGAHLPTGPRIIAPDNGVTADRWDDGGGGRRRRRYTYRP